MAGRGPRYPAPSSPVLSKLALVWAKRTTALYSHLSVNVLREVCRFFAFRPLLAACIGHELVVFDPASKVFLGVDMCTAGFAVYHTTPPAAVCIGDDQIFVCGGVRFERGRNYILAEAGFITLGQTPLLTEVSDMRTPRCYHGIHFDEVFARVFVFGGNISAYRPTNKCEQYDFGSGCWSKLPNMKHANKVVNVCRFQRKVILCGYSSQEFEEFGVDTKQFTIRPWQLFPVYVINFIAVWKTQLLIFQEEILRKWDLNSYSLISDSSVRTYWESTCTLVIDDVLYILRFNDEVPRCNTINLETMTLESEFTLQSKANRLQ